MAVCAVTRHAEHRIRERVGLPKKAVRRAAARAITCGVSHLETSGGLRRYLDYIYMRGYGEANNMYVYGAFIYLFCNDTLMTVYDVPQKYRKQAAKLMQRRRDDNGMQ